MKEAMFYEKTAQGGVVCNLCPHHCHIAPESAGRCRVRVNHDGVLFASSYARTVSLNLDPIEKKPIYHMNPGQGIVSVGNNACNLRCDFCQNYTISRQECPTHVLEPAALLDACRQSGAKMVAYTYTEPTTWIEYMLDTSRMLKQHGIRTVVVTNGYIEAEPLEALLSVTDAMNIDLKAMTERFYRDLCGASLEPVRKTIRRAAQSCLVEVTNLIIPGENDADIPAVIDFIASVDPEIPLHFSRYYPRYERNNPATPPDTLIRAYELAVTKLRHVYIGNLNTEIGSDTRCPDCGNLLIARSGYTVKVKGLTGGRCRQCGRPLKGVWDE